MKFGSEEVIQKEAQLKGELDEWLAGERGTTVETKISYKVVEKEIQTRVSSTPELHSKERRTLLVIKIKRNNSTWITYETEICEEAVNYFSSIFSSSYPMISSDWQDRINFIGKSVLIKALANRLKLVFNDCISPRHSAFVPRRLITDNILIAHELINFMGTKTDRKVGYCCIKIDMSKAYDRMKWDFQEKIPRRMGFPTSWIAKTMACVKTVSYRIKVNDIISSRFSPGRGIRQGDLLSPYLLVLCMEWLAQRLEKAQTHGEIHGIKMYWQHFGDELGRQNRKYLGLPISMNGRNPAIWNYLEDRMWKRVNGWKEKMISIAGKEWNSIISSFWWNDARESRYTAWRDKKKMQKVKEEGGLGLQNFQLRNLALLIKQAWRILAKLELLITKIYKARYFQKMDLLEEEVRAKPSWGWRSIHGSVTILKNWLNINETSQLKYIYTHYIPLKWTVASCPFQYIPLINLIPYSPRHTHAMHTSPGEGYLLDILS
ncbi:hypothetical protein QQ045_030740 [Rhodiola kirilowii]